LWAPDCGILRNSVRKIGIVWCKYFYGVWN
jgi:hypothetical protein